VIWAVGEKVEGQARSRLTGFRTRGSPGPDEVALTIWGTDVSVSRQPLLSPRVSLLGRRNSAFWLGVGVGLFSLRRGSYGTNHWRVGQQLRPRHGQAALQSPGRPQAAVLWTHPGTLPPRSAHFGPIGQTA